MAKPTEEQIRDLKKLLADIEDARQEAENLANTSKETLEAATGNLGQQYTDLVDEIKEALKQQYEFLSSQELSAEIQLKLIQKEKEERQKLIQLQQRQLGIIESVADAKRDSVIVEKQLADNQKEKVRLERELAAEEAKQNQNKAKINSLNKEIVKTEKEQQSIKDRQSKAQARVTSLTEKAVRNGVEENDIKGKTVDELQALVDAQRGAIDNQRDLTQESQRTSDAVTQSRSELQNQNAIIDNTIARMTGLKIATGGFTDLLIKASSEGGAGGLDKLFSQVGSRIKALTNPIVLVATALSHVGSVLNDLSNKVNELNFGIKSVATQIIEIPITFTRDMGLAQEVAKDLKELSKTSSDSGFLVAELDVAFRGLSKSMVSFTRMGTDSRKFLSEQAALLERAGLSTDAFGKSTEGLMKSMNMTDRQAAGLTEEIASFGKVVGMGADKAVQDFTANLDLLATFGDQKGVEIFKKLSIAANEAGVEIQTLNNIANKFETFDQAMHSAGKLNFILRGPFLNSMELLKATPEETLEILRRGFDNAGKSFDDFGRRGREAIASTLGVSVDVAKRLFDDRSIQSAKELETALMNRARSEGKLTDEMRDNLTLQQKQELLFEKILQILMPLSEKFNDFLAAVVEFGNIISPVLAGIGVFISALKELAVPLILILGYKGLGAARAKFNQFNRSMSDTARTSVTTAAKITTLAGAFATLTGSIMGAVSARKRYNEADEEDKGGILAEQAIQGGVTGLFLAGLLAPFTGGSSLLYYGGMMAAGAATTTAITALNEGTDNYTPGVGAGAGMSMMRRQSDIGLAVVGDGPGGKMLPTTEVVSLRQGDAVLNSGDVASMTSAIRSLPSVLQMFTEAAQKTNERAMEIATVNAGTGQQAVEVSLNLKGSDLKRFVEVESIKTLERGLQVPLRR